MDWSFRPDRPIYIQIAEGFRTSVATGELQPGDKLKSTKELAAWAGVSPNARSPNNQQSARMERSAAWFKSLGITNLQQKHEKDNVKSRVAAST